MQTFLTEANGRPCPCQSTDRGPQVGAIRLESWVTEEGNVAHPHGLPGTVRPERLLFAADIAGTLVFAAEGESTQTQG